MYFVMRGDWFFAKEIHNLAEIEKDPLMQGRMKRIKGRDYLILKEHKTPTYIGEYYIFTS